MLKYKSFILAAPKRSVISFRLTLGIFFSLFTLTCIERDNPLDPLLRGSIKHPLSQCEPDSSLTRAFRAKAMGIAVKTDSLSLKSRPFADTATTALFNAAMVKKFNDTILAKNQTTLSLNLAIDSFNRKQTVNDSLRLKSILTECAFPLLPPQFGFISIYQRLSDSLDSLWISYCRQCSDFIKSNTPFIDSQKSRLAGVKTVLDSIRNGYTVAKDLISLDWTSDSTDNAYVVAANLEIKKYNDSLTFLKSIQRYRQIKTVANLQDSIRVAKPGDTLILMRDTFTIATSGISGLTNSGNDTSPIVIMGNPKRTTIISTKTGVALSASNNFIFRYIGFTGSENSGFQVVQSAGIKFDHCSFFGNKENGIDIIDSRAPWMSDCKIFANGINGIHVSSQPGTIDPTLRLENVLIVKNGAYGISSTLTTISAINVTVSNNANSGMFVADPAQSVIMYKSLLTFNAGYGISFPKQADQLTVDNTVDIFGNSAGAISIDSLTAFNCLKVNPPYIDTAQGNFSIAPGGIIDSLQQRSVPTVIGFREYQ